MNPVENYIYHREDPEKEIMIILHDLFLEMGLVPKIRFKIPMYYHQSWICYVNPLKKGGVELCFLHGYKLDDPSGILDSKGRKIVCGISIRNPNQIAIKEISEFVLQSLNIENMK